MTVAAALLFVRANWRWIAAAATIVALAVAAWRWDAAAYDRGFAACRADAAAADTRRTEDANRADDAARRCAADPECRLRRDPYQRD